MWAICEIFVYNGVFGVRLLNDARQILPRPTPVAMAMKFEKKIGYKSACIQDNSEIFAFNSGFSGSGYWMMPAKFYHDQTRVAMATKFETKSAIYQFPSHYASC